MPRAHRVVRVAAVAGCRAACSLRGIRLPRQPYLTHAMEIALGRYELSLAEVIGRHLKGGETAIDVGANIGILSRAMAKAVGRTGTVFAFEPNPEAFELLRHNCGRFPQVSVHNVALGSARGKATLYFTGNPETGSLIAAYAKSQASGSLYGPLHSAEISIEHGATYLADRLVGRPSLIKIDVEGFELDVLEGLGDVIGPDFNGLLLVEVSPMSQRSAGRRPLEPVEWLLTHGFQTSLVSEDHCGRLDRFTAADHQSLLDQLGNSGYAMVAATRRSELANSP